MGARDYSATAASNLSVGGISIAEGWARASVNNAMREQLKDVANLLLDQGGEVTTTGSAPAYLLDLPSTPIAYADNLAFVCKLHEAVTGTSTININAIGIKDFKKVVGGYAVDLAAGDAPVGHRASCIYSSADNAVLMLNPVAFGNISDLGTPDDDDWTEIFQTAAATGRVYQLAANTTYTVTSQIECTVNGFGLIGPRSAKIYLPAADWGTLDLTDTTGAQTSVFYIHPTVIYTESPIENITFQGFAVEAEYEDGQYINVFFGRAIKNLIMEDLEIYGLSAGYGIRMSTIFGGRICRNYIHDFLLIAAPAFPHAPQLTAISLDAARVPGPIAGPNYNSQDVIISENIISDIVMSGGALTLWNDQTDGITHEGTQQSSRTIISDNIIANVGEGIDNFASTVIISNNRIEAARVTGIKMIHGAAWCTVSGNNIINSGVKGINICGVAAGYSYTTAFNNIIGNTIVGIDPDGLNAALSTACIRIEDPNALVFPAPQPGWPRDNLISDNYLNPSPGGKYAVLKGQFYNTFRRNSGLAGSVGWEVVVYASAGEPPTGVITAVPTFTVQSDPEIIGSWSRTATATDVISGPNTNWIAPDATSLVWVASAGSANDWVRLPPATWVGKKVRGWTSSAHELRTALSSGDRINGVVADGTNEAAIPASTHWEADCIATGYWVLRACTVAGVPLTAIVPDP